MKPLCSVCKTFLNPEKDGECVCPNCFAVYNLDKEIIEYEDDDFCSSHSDEQPEINGIGGSGSGLLPATDDQDPNLTDQLYKHWKHKPSDGSGASSWDSDY